MDDLFKKLNTLVKASVNDLLGDRKTDRGSKPLRLGKDVDREIAALRKRITEALDYEDKLQARVQELAREVERWDKQADDAILKDDDAAARHAAEQMQRAQQRFAMAESDLHEHQIVAQELIQQVNVLETAVETARRSQAESETDSRDSAKDSPEEESGGVLADALRDVREKVSGIARQTPGSAAVPEKIKTTDKQTVDDDLSERRKRLSKPEE